METLHLPQKNSPDEWLPDLLNILLFQEKGMESEVLWIFVAMAAFLQTSWRTKAQEVVLETGYDQQEM